MFTFNFKYDLSDLDRNTLFGIIAAVVIYIAAVAAVCLALYILRAIGIYKMSKTAGIEYPWLCFIPVANSFALGRIAEKYRKNPIEKPAKYSVILLILHIIEKIAEIAFEVLFFIIAVNATREVIGIALYDDPISEKLLLSLIPLVGISVFLMLSALAFAIVKYVALWRVYALFDGKNAVLFTVLSVLFNFLEPVFLFVIRNNRPNFAPLGNYNPENYEQ